MGKNYHISRFKSMVERADSVEYLSTSAVAPEVFIGVRDDEGYEYLNQLLEDEKLQIATISSIGEDVDELFVFASERDKVKEPKLSIFAKNLITSIFQTKGYDARVEDDWKGVIVEVDREDSVTIDFGEAMDTAHVSIDKIEPKDDQFKLYVSGRLGTWDGTDIEEGVMKEMIIKDTNTIRREMKVECPSCGGILEYTKMYNEDGEALGDFVKPVQLFRCETCESMYDLTDSSFPDILLKAAQYYET